MNGHYYSWLDLANNGGGARRIQRVAIATHWNNDNVDHPQRLELSIGQLWRNITNHRNANIATLNAIHRRELLTLWCVDVARGSDAADSIVAHLILARLIDDKTRLGATHRKALLGRKLHRVLRLGVLQAEQR